MAQIYFRQLLAGRDFAQGNPIAAQMQNFSYLVGDRDSGECLVIDPAWAVDDLVDAIEADDMKLVGVLATHYHPDHIGGHMFGIDVEGLPTLMARNPCPVHVHRAEVDGVRVMSGLEASDLVTHDSGDKVQVGGIEVELLHTPGHTPGSLCFRVKDSLIAGDTLFLQGCGRVDLPGGDPDEMFRTLHERLSVIPGGVTLYPGHDYGGASASMDQVRESNFSMRMNDRADWLRLMGG